MARAEDLPDGEREAGMPLWSGELPSAGFMAGDTSWVCGLGLTSCSLVVRRSLMIRYVYYSVLSNMSLTDRKKRSKC